MRSKSASSRTYEYHRTPNLSVKRIALMASTVAFEFNKATLKLRRSLRLDQQPSSPKSTKKEKKIEEPTSTKSTSRGSKRNQQLCAELSSFALYPLFGALTPTHFSSPNLLFQSERKNELNLTDVTDEIIAMIARKLDAKSLLSLSQTNQRMRQICIREENYCQRRDVNSHEIVISFNRIKKRTEVRLLKKERTRDDSVFIGYDIETMLSPFTRALTKITLETGIYIEDWLDEILKLYEENKLVPLAMVFSGGALTKANQVSGADLKCISESEFIEFVGKLQPYLQEVQLQTSRIFKTSTSPPRLLGLISMLSSFGIIYERPPLRFFFDEISKVVSFWKDDVLSRSCDVYMSRPRDSSIEKWNKMGNIDEAREDPYTGEVLVSKITIKHSFLVHIDLTFHFH